MTQPTTQVEIPDPALAALVREALDLQSQDPIHESDLQALEVPPFIQTTISQS